MKILYAIQGTGNGHVARAREIIPLLQTIGEVDVLIGGDQSEVDLPVVPKYAYRGLTFKYNAHGGVSYWKTLFTNNLFQLAKNILACPVHDYDILLNDFEFISAWACKLRKLPCLGIGHQAAFKSPLVPRPVKKDALGEYILKHYAPASISIGFHFQPYDSFVATPVIRREVRNLCPQDHGHIVVYLPAYGLEELVLFLQPFSQFTFHVFTKHKPSDSVPSHIVIQQISNQSFLSSLESCAGLFTSAGFESPAEALFLGKKLAVIPIQNQYEQACNAAALAELGIPVWDSLKKASESFHAWLLNDERISIKYPDDTLELLQLAISKYQERLMLADQA